jgi:hypothetical protein
MAMTLTSNQTLAGAVQPGTLLPVSARGAAPTSSPEASLRCPPPTADALRLVDTGDPRFDLVPVGVALHSFTDPVRQHAGLPCTELHRATTVLTKQIRRLLADPCRLQAIRDLVTDPLRVALPDGRTAATLCGDAWSTVQAIADERAAGAVEGARAFGETAILRLAATRASMPTIPWWGTRGWTELVDRWASDHRDERHTIATLLRSPETADDETLAVVLDH